jgi:hypothetical protein
VAEARVTAEYAEAVVTQSKGARVAAEHVEAVITQAKGARVTVEYIEVVLRPATQTIAGTGTISGETFGGNLVQLIVRPLGDVLSGETLGILAVVSVIGPAGIPSAEAFGLDGLYFFYNDLVSSSVLVGEIGTLETINIGATMQPGEPETTAGTGTAGIWFRITPTYDGFLSLDTAGSTSEEFSDALYPSTSLDPAEDLFPSQPTLLGLDTVLDVYTNLGFDADSYAGTNAELYVGLTAWYSDQWSIDLSGYATGGTFTITWNGYTTEPITWDPGMSRIPIEDALATFPNVNPGDIVIWDGWPYDRSRPLWDMEFSFMFWNGLGGEQPAPTVDVTGLTGYDAPYTASVERNTQGGYSGRWGPINPTDDTSLMGTFTFSYEGDTTEPIDVRATTEEMTAALEALPSIGPGNVRVSPWYSDEVGWPWGSSEDPWYDGLKIEFTGALGKRPITGLTASTNLTGQGNNQHTGPYTILIDTVIPGVMGIPEDADTGSLPFPSLKLVAHNDDTSTSVTFGEGGFGEGGFGGAGLWSSLVMPVDGGTTYYIRVNSWGDVTGFVVLHWALTHATIVLPAGVRSLESWGNELSPNQASFEFGVDGWVPDDASCTLLSVLAP